MKWFRVAIGGKRVLLQMLMAMLWICFMIMKILMFVAAARHFQWHFLVVALESWRFYRRSV